MIYVYVDRTGRILVNDWLLELQHRDQSIYKKVMDTIELMANDNLPLEPPNVRHMTKRTKNKNLYKIRLGKYRLFFLKKGQDYYLLHAFRKTSQTTPAKEIKQVLREIKSDNYELFK